jgi:hypothetical protein
MRRGIFHSVEVWVHQSQPDLQKPRESKEAEGAGGGHMIDSLERQQNELREMYFQQQKALEELKSQGATQHQQQLEHASGDPSQRRSSVSSTELRANEAPMDRYPVDDISGKTNCEMHQSMKNISMKVAVGYALPSRPGQVWHGLEI